MTRALLLAICLLLSSCVSTKPFFFAADYHDQEVFRVLAVFHGDFETDDVNRVVAEAVDEFYKRTNIRAHIAISQSVNWRSREFYAMQEQVVELYPERVVPADWVLMIYRKTVMEWVLLPLLGNVEGAAEAGGQWAFVNRLDADLIVHELYHLGWRVK